MKPNDQILEALAARYPGEMIVSVAIRLDSNSTWAIIQSFDRDATGHPKTEGNQNHLKTIERPATQDELRYLASLILQAADQHG